MDKLVVNQDSLPIVPEPQFPPGVRDIGIENDMVVRNHHCQTVCRVHVIDDNQVGPLRRFKLKPVFQFNVGLLGQGKKLPSQWFLTLREVDPEMVRLETAPPQCAVRPGKGLGRPEAPGKAQKQDG